MSAPLQRCRLTRVSAVLAQHGVQLSAVRGDKLRLDRRIPNDKAHQLAADLKAANPNIAEAYADLWATIQFTPQRLAVSAAVALL